MSWSLEVFSPRAGKVTVPELAARLANLAPPLTIVARSPDATSEAPAPKASTPEASTPKASPGDQWQTLFVAATANAAQLMARVQAVLFEAEREADPQLIPLFELEIAESDAEDGAVDEQYTAHLRQMLQETRWHYTIGVHQNDRPEQQRAVVQTSYVLSQIAGGIVHDLQSGAWMDAGLFENLLDAYGVNECP